MTVKRALLSVSDKTGILDFARALVAADVAILSSGGTAGALADAGIPVTPVPQVTGAPEILDGRVKTLHPRIHAGILADRAKPEHMAQLEELGVEPIDLVVCNLYPFERTVAELDVSLAEAVEQIDIGGPAMVRAAAKNFASVTVVVNPERYEEVARQITSLGGVAPETRKALALEAFQHTAAYDTAISAYLAPDDAWPDRLMAFGEKVQDLRYGENPHQMAVFYKSPGEPRGLAGAEQLHGKELSFNNLLDTDAAWRLVLELPRPAVAIIKHSNPCGVALGRDVSDAYQKALDCDRTSAFGGIVGLNDTCDLATAQQIAAIFTEVVIAPRYEPDALAMLREKKNMRVLQAEPVLHPSLDMRSIAGGLLVQSADPPDPAEDAKVVTVAQPSEQQWRDLRFAWTVAKHVKSNAIVLARDGVAFGVGAGQMSRVESTQLAAERAGERAKGAVCASDAFFPFRDGLDAAVEAGAAAVIQPGGSIRDDAVIAAADEHGIPMVFTGRRHFRH